MQSSNIHQYLFISDAVSLFELSDINSGFKNVFIERQGYNLHSLSASFAKLPLKRLVSRDQNIGVSYDIVLDKSCNCSKNSAFVHVRDLIRPIIFIKNQ